MVKVGEHSGELGGMLGHVAAYAVERHRQLQRRVVALIEPISILVIGLVLAIIMVGVVLAMASLTEIKL
jgi:general secretion pathway protein F